MKGSLSASDRVLARQLFQGAGWRIVRSELVLRRLAMEVHVEATGWKAACARCGRRCPVHDVKARHREWRHTCAWGLRTIVIASLRRVRCRGCGVRIERIPWARPRSHFTVHFEAEILGRVRDAPVQAVCRQLGVHWTSVMRLVERWVDRAAPRHFRAKLCRIGVDEASYGRGRQKYLTLVWDHDRRQIVWIEKGSERATLGVFFAKLGPRRARELRCVTMDMAPGYVAAAREQAPGVDIVFDRFHIERHLTHALNEVRKAELRRAGRQHRDIIRGKKFLLMRKRRRLHWRLRRDLDLVFQISPRLRKAYALKEQFADIWAATDEVQMAARLLAWRQALRWQHLRPFERFWEMIRSHAAGVLAWVRHRLTNAALESHNARVRSLSLRAHGYRNPRNLITMLYFCSWRTPPPPSHPKAR